MDKFKEEEGGEMVEERPSENQEQPSENIAESVPESQQKWMNQIQILEFHHLMNKRAKLEEAIDYVGGLIANLKEKRTNLEKEIEEESVDIRI